MGKESNFSLYSLYCLLFILTAARIKEVLNYEFLRNEEELHSALQKYGTRLGGEMAHRANSILRRFCSSNSNCELMAPFKVYYPEYTIAGWPRRISSCIIPKNMSTVISAIFCLLFTGEMGRTDKTVTSFVERSCSPRNGLHRYSQVEKLAHGYPWMNFAMVRDPAERFLSGFMYMCSSAKMVNETCEGCIGDLKCALRRTLEHSQKFASGDLSADSNLLWHLGPQNWHCDLQHNIDKFELIQYSPNDPDKVAADLRYVLTVGGVEPWHIELILSQVSNGTTCHATTHLAEKSVYMKQMEDPEVKELLTKRMHSILQVFFWDYVLFNYPLPKWEF
ncbi:unnamed protein product [Cylicocyclus nassatus]|uniref:Sulfotransferase n=1 Tax=Cylicocyclus nassatus TaxID=53992 RepID=A0AA36H4G1_CYLNA|nr:unnamed protein product [Cylicocyclus nassatus]